MTQALSASEPTAVIPDLRDKVLLITGASTGIGAAAARAFGRNGAKVAINCFLRYWRGQGLAMTLARRRDRGAGGGMRAGAAGLRASGSRRDLRSRAALPLCRPRSVGRGGSAPSAPRSMRDVGQGPPQICESDRDRAPRGRDACGGSGRAIRPE